MSTRCRALFTPPFPRRAVRLCWAARRYRAAHLCRAGRPYAGCLLALLLCGAITLAAAPSQAQTVDQAALSSPISVSPLDQGLSPALSRVPGVDPVDEEPGRWVPSIGDIGGDVLNVVTAPVRVSRRDALQLAGASGLVVGIMAGLDRPAARQFPPSSGGPTASIASPLAAPGRWYDDLGPDNVAIGTVSAFAVSGIVLQDRRLTRTSVNLLEAVAITKAVTGVFKGLAGRARPYGETGPWDLEAAEFGSQHLTRSMPSGHTSRAFALASVIAHEYPAWWVQLPAYSVAASVGVQRMQSGNHWLSDVVVGGALGYLIGRTVADDGRSNSGRLQYDPIVSTHQVGLRLRF